MKKFINISLISASILAIIIFAVFIPECVYAWNLRAEVLKNPDSGMGVIQSTNKICGLYTFAVIAAILIAAACIAVLVIVNRTEIKEIIYTAQTYREKKQTEKYQKEESEKQRKIEKLQKQIDDLKNTKDGE